MILASLKPVYKLQRGGRPPVTAMELQTQVGPHPL